MSNNQQIRNCCFPRQTQVPFFPNQISLFLNEVNQVRSLKLFWLVASSLGVASFWQQSAQAGTALPAAFPIKGENLTAELDSRKLVSTRTTIIGSSNSVVSSKKNDPNGLVYNNSNLGKSLPLSQPSFSSDLQQNKLVIPQLPSLVSSTLQPDKITKIIHTVRAGDTVAGISRKYGVPSKQIIKENRLTNPNFIKINHQLVIPSKKFTKGVARSEALKKRKYSLNNNFIDPALVSETPLNFSKNPKPNLASSQVKVITNNQKNEIDPSSKNHYISKLRQDIVRLRSEYQRQSRGNQPRGSLSKTSIEIEPPNSKAADTKSKINSNQLFSKTTTSDSVAAVPSSEKLTNPTVKTVKNFALVPELPPLASPEEYLPNSPTFNGYVWPAQGTLTSGYGWRWGRLHKGIDIAAPIGTPIIAAAPGEVIFAGWNSGGYGNLIKLKHQDGSVTLYAHNNRLLIRSGQQVKQGQLIAEMGSTGRSSGPHLHFEIRPNGSSAINPMAMLPEK